MYMFLSTGLFISLKTTWSECTWSW